MRIICNVLWCKVVRFFGGNHRWILVKKAESDVEIVVSELVTRKSTLNALGILGPCWQRTWDAKSADGMVCVRCDAVTFWDDISYESYLEWKNHEGV
jgi:hypothetical protein